MQEGQEAAASTESGPSTSSQPDLSDGEQQEGKEAPKRDKGAKGEEDDKDDQGEPSSSTAREGEGEAEPGEGGDAGATESVLTEDDLIQQSQAEYDSGRYSPTLLQSSELPLDAHVVEIDEDLHRLHLARRQLQVTGGCTCSAHIFTFILSHTHTIGLSIHFHSIGSYIQHNVNHVN